MTAETEANAIFENEAEIPEEEQLRKKLLLSSSEMFSSPSDPDIETLVRRIKDSEIVLRPKFQRTAVWNNKLKSRLIESLLLNLPIPPVFLAEDDDVTKVVVDGQQRLRAVDDFYRERFSLEGLEILQELNGKTFTNMDAKLQRRFLNRVIRVLTIPYRESFDVRYLIFERLNTNTVPLNDQEIRNATLFGGFNELLDRLANNENFLEMLRVAKPDERLRHHELVLKFFSSRYSFSTYSTPLKLFLTDYMKSNRRTPIDTSLEMEKVFLTGCENVKQVFGANSFRRYNSTTQMYQGQLSRAVFELQLVSLATLGSEEVKQKSTEIETAFKDLCSQIAFSELLTRGTDHRKRFYRRFSLWLKKLDELGLRSELIGELPDVREFN